MVHVAVAHPSPSVYFLKWSVTPTFSFQIQIFVTVISALSKNEQKVNEGSEKKSRFLSTEHRIILPYCGCKARETMIAKCELFIDGTPPVDYLTIIPRARMGSESIAHEAETEWAIDSEAMRARGIIVLVSFFHLISYPQFTYDLFHMQHSKSN